MLKRTEKRNRTYRKFIAMGIIWSVKGKICRSQTKQRKQISRVSQHHKIAQEEASGPWYHPNTSCQEYTPTLRKGPWAFNSKSRPTKSSPLVTLWKGQIARIAAVIDGIAMAIFDTGANGPSLFAQPSRAIEPLLILAFKFRSYI